MSASNFRIWEGCWILSDETMTRPERRSGLLRQTNLSYELNKPRIGTNTIKLERHANHRHTKITLLVSSLQPGKALVLLTKSRVISSDDKRRKPAGGGLVQKLVETLPQIPFPT